MKLDIFSYIVTLSFEREVMLEACRGDNPFWKITEGCYCLNRELEWIYEPLPSSRTEEFINATRFDFQEAIGILEKLEKQR